MSAAGSWHERLPSYHARLQLDAQHRSRRFSQSFLFFFFFYSHLPPHSPTGMAGGPIRTPTQGANYVHTKTKRMETETPPPTHIIRHAPTACCHTRTCYPTPTKALSRATKNSPTLSLTTTLPPSPSTVYRHFRLSSISSHEV